MWEFMLSQGMVLLFGNKFHPDVDKTEFKSVLLSSPNGNIKVSKMKGVQFDIISHGMNITLKDKIYDALTPVDPQDRAEPVLALSGNKYAAVKGQTCSYRLLFTTFQPGDIVKQEELNYFILKSLEWFLGNKMGIGQIAPDSEIQNINGRNEGLYMHMPPTDIVIIEFFATWCSYCKEEKPILAKIKKEYKGKVGILNIDYKEENDLVIKYLKDKENSDITWDIIIDKLGLASKKYGVKALPALYILDKERRVHYIGNFTTKETLVNEIEKIIKSSETKIKVDTLNQK
jgi:cytochrome c biogenesis protein CcmG/thiol:disulfide interchange protein DsbE